MKRISVSFFLCAGVIAAQGNYEIQVYPYKTQAPGSTMFELHSNFTFQGSKGIVDGVQPTEHQLHETVEITQGFTNWFETGFYIFTSANPNQGGWQWVGDHIRPRVRVPEEWKWPVGVSLSLEFGYQRHYFSADTWTLEIRPIVDKQIGRWYLAFNPTFDRSFHGPSVSQGLVFSPNFKAGLDFTKKINAGLEYYGSLEITKVCWDGFCTQMRRAAQLWWTRSTPAGTAYVPPATLEGRCSSFPTDWTITAAIQRAS